MVTDVIKWHSGPPALKFHIEDYENKDRLSVCRIFSPQRTPKLGRTKPSTGPRVGHSWIRNWFIQEGFSFFLFCGCIKEKIVPY